MPEERIFVNKKKVFEEKVKKSMENKCKVNYVSVSQQQAHTKTLKTIMAHLKSSGYFVIASSFFSL